MKRQISLLFIVFVLGFFVIINGCGKDNPVYYGNGGGITRLNTNGTIVPVNRTQASGSMFITDQNGNPISGITSSNVTAQLRWGSLDSPLDSGVVGTVTLTSNTQNGNNVAGAITMDLSGSMGSDQIYCMQNAVKTYINAMKTNDISEIIKFSSDVEVIQAFTGDKNLLRAADTTYWTGTGGSTALYQSIYQATNDAKLQSSNLVRSVIAFTDGGENYSTISRADMISNAITGGIPVYTIFLYSDTSNSYYKDMKNIADTTGGFNFWSKPDSCNNLTQIYNTISGQLASSYSITINWQGTLPPTGTVVRAVITTTYNSLSSSFTRSFVIP
jgi:hypothetical protein